MIDTAPRRQQSPADRAFGIQKINGNRGGKTGHAVNPRRSGLVDHAVGGLDQQIGHRTGIDGAHPHPCMRIRRFDQAARNGKRADTGENIAAIGRSIDQRTIHRDLAEQIIDINPRLARARDHRHFAGQRMRAADPVDLTRIGRTHDRQQDGAIALQINLNIGQHLK